MQQQELLVSLLTKECGKRTKEDVNFLSSYLRNLDCVSALTDVALEQLCQRARYETHAAGTELYRLHEKANSWYILITGNVFIDGIMFIPPSSFGKRIKGSGQRNSNCLVLDDSEFIVIDYRSPCHDEMTVAQMKPLDDSLDHGGPDEDTDNEDVEQMNQGSENWIIHKTSDVNKFCISNELPRSLTGCNPQLLGSDDARNFDFLKETSVDSDAEDQSVETFYPAFVKDAVKECLDRRPNERSEDDIEIILEFMQHFPAFSNMTVALRRAMCAVVAYAVIEPANTLIYDDGQEFDSWSIVINGEVEIARPDGTFVTLHVGDSFGVQPDLNATSAPVHHAGTMYTKTDNCQFVCVAKEDFYTILHQGAENTEKLEEHGKIVLVTEKRPTKRRNNMGSVVIRGTPERLITHLIEDQSSADPTYAEDFLLTSRAFLTFPSQLADHLLTWLKSDVAAVRDKAVRVALLWVNNHFSDFEFEPELNDFLAEFENFLTSQAMEGQLKLLSIACSVKSHQRQVILAREGPSEEWPFSVFSRSDATASVCIRSVRRDASRSAMTKSGVLLRGDEILKLNNCCLDLMSYHKVLDLLKSATKLDMTVRFNIEAFREALKSTSMASSRGLDSSGWGSDVESNHRFFGKRNKAKSVKRENNKLGGGGGEKQKLSKLVKLLSGNNILGKQTNNGSEFFSDFPFHREPSARRTLLSSGSHPDLTNIRISDDSDTPDQLIKVHGLNQTSKSLLVSKEMTVAEVVAMATKEFGFQTPSRYCLCLESDDTVDKAEAKMTVLPNHLTNVPDMIRPKSKLYLVSRPTSMDATTSKCLTESSYLIRSQSSLLQLQPEELAKQLTSRDLLVFRDIASVEYVVDVMELQSNYGTPNLNKFIKMVNEEMFWVVTEVCVEGNVDNRARLIQKFIKLAKLCKEANNFNSMFFIISGLNHGAISRLKLTWEKVPTKYHKLFKSMQDLLNPSRNLSNYRNLLNSQLGQVATIPFFPIVKKDLTFIHLGNDSKVEGLVNFEKLRMFAKEVRRVTNMASSYYHNFPQQNAVDQTNSAATSSATLPANHGSSPGASMFATLRKKKPLPARLNSRWLLDENQMIQRVRDYLANLFIIDNEDKLLQLSSLLEPSANSRKKTSPVQPVTDSSVAPAADLKQNVSGQKFGANSTQAVQKLMSLTDKVKPHDQKKHPVPNIQPSPDLHRKAKSSQPKQRPRVHLSAESSSIAGSPNHSRSTAADGGRTTKFGLVNQRHSADDDDDYHHAVDLAAKYLIAGATYVTKSNAAACGTGVKTLLSSDQLDQLGKTRSTDVPMNNDDSCLLPFSNSSASAPVSPCHGRLHGVGLPRMIGHGSDDVLAVYPKQMPRDSGARSNHGDDEALISVI